MIVMNNDNNDFEIIKTRIQSTLALPIREEVKPENIVSEILIPPTEGPFPEVFESEYECEYHNGPPKMRYEYIREEDRWIDNADPDIKAQEIQYFEEQRKQKE